MVGSVLSQLMDIAKKEEDQRLAKEADRLGVTVEQVREAEKTRLEKVFEHPVGNSLFDEKERERRQAYGESIGLGVAAYNGIVVSIGGLSARSAGNGITKSTVEHVILDEELHRGRLHRQRGDLLCKPASKLGSRTMGVSDGDGHDWEESRVTCQACLKIMERIKRRK